MDFLIDSNVLIAFLKNTDSCHKKALNLIHSLDRFSIVEDGLAEVSTILLLKESKEIAKSEKGNLYIDIETDHLYPALMQFIGTVLKVSNMRLYKREVIQSLFFEMLDEFIQTQLAKYQSQKDYYPLPNMPEYKVDYCFNHRKVPIYLFGVNGAATARLTVISCQKFIIEKIKFRSMSVLESLDCLGKKDQSRLMSVADKVFPEFNEFEKTGDEYTARELDLLS